MVLGACARAALVGAELLTLAPSPSVAGLLLTKLSQQPRQDQSSGKVVPGAWVHAEPTRPRWAPITLLKYQKKTTQEGYNPRFYPQFLSQFNTDLCHQVPWGWFWEPGGNPGGASEGLGSPGQREERVKGAGHAGEQSSEQAEQPTTSVLESWEQEPCERGERRHRQQHPRRGQAGGARSKRGGGKEHAGRVEAYHVSAGSQGRQVLGAGVKSDKNDTADVSSGEGWKGESPSTVSPALAARPTRSQHLQGHLHPCPTSCPARVAPGGPSSGRGEEGVAGTELGLSPSTQRAG